MEKRQKQMSRKQIIDFHAHILPGMDHGCRNLEETYEQLCQAKDAGADVVIATSHFYPHKERLEHFVIRRESAYKSISGQKDGRKFPKVKPGAEVFVCRGMERLEGIEQLCIAGTNIILLEMPLGDWTRELMETVLAIQERLGLQVVLAHVDRYEENGVQQLFDQGIHGQLNAEALSGLFVKKRFRRWIQNGDIVALGSDIHGVKPGYREFLKVKKFHEASFDTIMERTSKLLKDKL